MIVLGIDPGLAERRSCVFAPGELEYTTKKSTTRRWLKNRRGRGKIPPQTVESTMATACRASTIHDARDDLAWPNKPEPRAVRPSRDLRWLGPRRAAAHEAGGLMRRALVVLPLTLLLLAARIDPVFAQIPARVEPPYTLIDAESRVSLQVGAETPLRGNGPLTGYGYFFYTRPRFLDEDLYLRLVIPPGYLISELIHDHWPSQHSAVGVGVSGGLWADSQGQFRDGRFEEEESFSGHSAGATLAYYLRGPKIGGLLPLQGQIRANPRYIWYDRTDDTSHDFRLPDNTAIYDVRAGIRLGGVPPELFPEVSLELSVWHAVSYRDKAGRYGLPERPEKSRHLTQRTWTRVGGIYTFWGTQVSAFLNAGIAEDADALSAFRLGGGSRLRAEFPLLLHGYNIEEIFARRFLLVNLAYRFPIWPGQDRVHLQLLADYAWVDYIQGHRLPRSGLAGVGANLSVALTRRITLAVGYGYGVDAPRNGGFGGHAVNMQVEYKYWGW